VWRRRIEAGLRLAEPGLNLLLFVADRVSRAADRETDAYVPPRRSDGTLPRHVQASAASPAATD